MTRPLDITERQVRVILKAARKEGYRVEIPAGKTLIALVPDIPGDRPQDGRRVDRDPEVRF